MMPLKKIAACAGVLCATGLFGTQNVLAALPIQHWTQPSGAQVYLVESPSIPILDVQIDVDAGSRRDPVAQAGLASVTAGLATNGVRAVGGLPALDENALGEAWADLGASFDASASADRMSFSLRTLTEPDLLDRAISLAARQLGEPAFAADIWARDRARMTASWKEANTRPAVQAGRAYSAAVYGSHPYGFESTPDTWARISVADMQALYSRSILPCRTKVSVVGAVTRAQADTLVQRLLARLPQTACSPQAVVPEVQPLQQASDRRIPFDSAQAHVYIGQPGIKRNNPDYFSLIVGNYILGGGGFVSRLTTEVRERRGLSYSVFSDFSPGLHAGAFTVGLQTRPDQANEAVQVVRDVVTGFVKGGPTEGELEAAKSNLIGGFALRIDSNGKLLGNVANIAWNGLPLNYLDTWTQQVARVSTADIRNAFSRTLQPSTMATVVVGAQKP